MIYFADGSKLHTWEDFGPNNASITNIAKTLSQICRFGGNTGQFFSVAEHCVLVSNLCTSCPKEALLHDAVEAFTGDIISPVKTMMTPAFDDVEAIVLKAIERKLGAYITSKKPEWKPFDEMVLHTEINHFFNGKKSNLLLCMKPEAAYECFMERWSQVK